MQLGDNSCSAEEFFTADDDLQVHIDFSQWEDDFFSEIGPSVQLPCKFNE